MNANDLSQVINYVRTPDGIGSGGQPTPDQFQALADAGYRVVVNLALPDSDDALPDEGAYVTHYGMDYVHLPVPWRDPTPERFRRFRDVMRLYEDVPAFVHCAMNMRASAFVFLYRVVERHVPVAVAESAMTTVWQPNRLWADFIDKVLDAASQDD
jgi:protein tyrosine phosphatase (PTP) superfamily phosphohydrolase (DUF442 family)